MAKVIKSSWRWWQWVLFFVSAVAGFVIARLAGW